MTPSCSRTTRTERQRIGPVSLSGPTANSSSQNTSENRYVCPGCGGTAPLARKVSNERHRRSLCKAIASRTELVFFTSLGISMKIRNLEPSTALAESESIRNWEICAKLCTKWGGRGTFASLRPTFAAGMGARSGSAHGGIWLCRQHRGQAARPGG